MEGRVAPCNSSLYEYMLYIGYIRCKTEAILTIDKFRIYKWRLYLLLISLEYIKKQHLLLISLGSIQNGG